MGFKKTPRATAGLCQFRQRRAVLTSPGEREELAKGQPFHVSDRADSRAGLTRIAEREVLVLGLSCSRQDRKPVRINQHPQNDARAHTRHDRHRTSPQTVRRMDGWRRSAPSGRASSQESASGQERRGRRMGKRMGESEPRTANESSDQRSRRPNRFEASPMGSRPYFRPSNKFEPHGVLRYGSAG